MHAISIGTEHLPQEIISRLDEEFQFLHGEGIDVEMSRQCRGNFTFFDCSVRSASPEAEARFRHYLASAISDVIVDRWEEHLIRRIIRGQYYYFSRDEQERILAYAGRNLTTDDHGQDRSLQHRLSRKARILHRLRDYLDQNRELVVEGFVHFRLRDYLEELEDAVDRAVDDFLMEREHKEFIRLLQYFVDAQEPRVAEVHVLIAPGGSFRLVDAEGNSLQSELLEDFVAEVAESEISHEDLLISALITLAPTRLVLHGPVPPAWEDGVGIVKGVFQERVAQCPACSLCAPAAPAALAPGEARGAGSVSSASENVT